MARHESETAFLNVDVDVYSDEPLDRLASALGRRVSIHRIGREGRRHGAHFSLYAPGNVDAAVRRLVKIIAGLPAAQRQLWNRARTRVFNVGIQAGTSPFSSEFAVSESAVAAAASINASIVVTVYAPDDRTARRG